MILVKKEFKSLKNGFIDTEVYKDGNFFIKTVKGQEFDIQSFNKFITLYPELVVNPVYIDYDQNNRTLTYKLADVSKYMLTEHSTHQDLYTILINIISMFKYFLEFSAMVQNSQVFYHTDMKKDNMIFIDNVPKLIDIDSFMWKSKNEFDIYSVKCIKKIFGISWGEMFSHQNIPINYREDWYNTKNLDY